MNSDISPAEKIKDSALVRISKLLGKIGVTIICFWYISKKIDFSQALSALSKASWQYLLVALIFFILSKVLSAFRLNINFQNIGLRLPPLINLRLYWLGMFYNLFLPGAISGDAYKIIRLKRRYNSDYRKVSAAVLLDRFSGVMALAVILGAYGYLVLDKKIFQIAILSAGMISLLVFYLLVRYFLKDFLPGFLTTFVWGLGVQCCQVICVYFILLSLPISWHQHEWIFIFLAAAVISVLPLSLGGGLGTREVVFAEGARFFHLDPQVGVVISLLFYLVTVAGSVWGVYYSFHDPLKENEVTSKMKSHG